MFVSHSRIHRQQREGSHVFIVTLLEKNLGFIFQLDFLIKFEEIADWHKKADCYKRRQWSRKKDMEDKKSGVAITIT